MPRQISIQKNSWGSGARACRHFLRILQHAAEKPFELSRFGLAEATQKTVRDVHRYLTHAWVRRTSLLRQLEIDEPPVLRVACAADQTFGLQPIEHARHRTRVVGDDLAEVSGRFRLARPRGEIRHDDPLRGAHFERCQALVVHQLAVDGGQHLHLHTAQQRSDAASGLVTRTVVNVTHSYGSVNPHSGRHLHLLGGMGTQYTCLGCDCQGFNCRSTRHRHRHACNRSVRTQPPRCHRPPISSPSSCQERSCLRQLFFCAGVLRWQRLRGAPLVRAGAVRSKHSRPRASSTGLCAPLRRWTRACSARWPGGCALSSSCRRCSPASSESAAKDHPPRTALSPTPVRGDLSLESGLGTTCLPSALQTARWQAMLPAATEQNNTSEVGGPQPVPEPLDALRADLSWDGSGNANCWKAN